MINLENSGDSKNLNISDDKLCKSDDDASKYKVRNFEGKGNKNITKINSSISTLNSLKDLNYNEKKNQNNIRTFNQSNNNSIFGIKNKITYKLRNSKDRKTSENSNFTNENSTFTNISTNLSNISNTNKNNKKIYNPTSFKNLLNQIMRDKTNIKVDLITNLDKNPNEITQSSYEILKNNFKDCSSFNDNITTNNIFQHSVCTLGYGNSSSHGKMVKSNLNKAKSTSNINMIDKEIVENLSLNNYKISSSQKNNFYASCILSKSKLKFDSINETSETKNATKFSENSNMKILRSTEPHHEININKLNKDGDYYNIYNKNRQNEEISKNCRELLKIISKYKLVTNQKYLDGIDNGSANTIKINDLSEELNSLKNETLDLYFKSKETSSQIESSNSRFSSDEIEKSVLNSANYNLKIIDLSSERRICFYKNCFDLCKESLKELKHLTINNKYNFNFESTRRANIIENNIIINNNENIRKKVNLNLNLNLNTMNPSELIKNTKQKLKKTSNNKYFKNPSNQVIKRKFSLEKSGMNCKEESVDLSESMTSEGIKVKIPDFNYSVKKPKENNLIFKKLPVRMTYKRLNYYFNNKKREDQKTLNERDEDILNSDEGECNSLNETVILKENHNYFQKKFELRENIRMRSKSVLNIEIRKFVNNRNKNNSNLKKEKFYMNDDSVVKVRIVSYS